MKLIVIISVLVCVSLADKLDNTYLPPTSAHGSGGSGSFLSTPFGGVQTPFRGLPSTRFGGSSLHPGSFPVAPTHTASYNTAGEYYNKNNAGPHIGIVRYDNNNDGLGSYSYTYETENRIQAQESGELKNIGTDHEANSVHGSYSYVGPDGIPITTSYVADENGFRVSGAHLPTPPPIPEAILRSIQFNNANPSSDDGRYNAAYDNGGQYRTTAFSTDNQYLPPHKSTFSQQPGGYRY